MSKQKQKNYYDNYLFRTSNGHFRPIIFSGPPGCGKSDTARRLIKDAIFSIHSLAENCDPNAFGTYPVPVVDLNCPDPAKIHNVITQTSILPLLKRNIGDGYGILLLDDVTLANPQVMNTILNLAQNYCIGEHKLGINVLLVITGNGLEDGAGACSWNKPLLGRCCFIQWKADFNKWINHEHNQNMNSLILYFLKEHEDFFAPKVNAKDFTDTNGKTPSPRDWTELNNSLKNFDNDLANFEPSILYKDRTEYIASFVGWKAAESFIIATEHFIKYPKVHDLIRDPDSWNRLPNEMRNSPTARFTVCYSLRNYVFNQAANQSTIENRQMMDNYFKLVLNIADRSEDMISMNVNGLVTMAVEKGMKDIGIFNQVLMKYMKENQTIRRLVELNQKVRTEAIK